jgi:hypothetical protein
MPLPTVQSNVTALRAVLGESQVSQTPSGGIGGFLKFSAKDGTFLYGRDHDEVTGDTLLIDSGSIQHGWLRWTNKVATKVMVAMNMPLPPPLDTVGNDVPSEARSFSGAFMDGENEAVTFESNTHGGRGGIDRVLQAITGRLASGTDYLYPEVRLESTSYVHKSHGSEIFNPMFTVVNWRDHDGRLENDKLEDLPDEAPEEPTEEAEPPKKAPARRRRATA